MRNPEILCNEKSKSTVPSSLRANSSANFIELVPSRTYISFLCRLGIDPATDLRGCGLLGLMNLLYIVSDPHAHALAASIYKLSQHETQNFPFSVMSINITRIALQTLREGKLNR